MQKFQSPMTTPSRRKVTLEEEEERKKNSKNCFAGRMHFAQTKVLDTVLVTDIECLDLMTGLSRGFVAF